MRDLERWQEDNNEFLVAATRWLRRRLRLHALNSQASAVPPLPVAPPSEAVMTPRRGLFRRATVAPSPTPPLHLLPPASITPEQVEAAAKHMNEIAERMDPPPASLILARRFGLSSFEHDLLLLCIAVELDTRVADLCAQAQGEELDHPTFALAMALFDNPEWDARSPQRPLRYWQLIEIDQPASRSLTASSLRADERVVNYAKGLNYLDERLAPLVVLLEGVAAEAPLPPSQQTVVDAVVTQISSGDEIANPSLIQLLGADSPSKQLIARHAAQAIGLLLYRLPAAAIPTPPAEIETLARLWQRESMLVPSALYLDAREETGDATPRNTSLDQFLERAGGLFFLDTREAVSVGRLSISFDVAKPTPAEQQQGWIEEIGEDNDAVAARLAAQFNLNLATIQEIARAAIVNTTGDQRPLDACLWEACLRRTRPRLDQLAQRVEPKATWRGIVLPKTEKRLLAQIARQVAGRSRVYEEWGFREQMNRGLGINALFAGDSGTGKTMAAEVIANYLQLNLYRIDLSAVVSKYIGETEKNLRRLFDAAEDGGAILFFDEADAIFGKRSEVRDSHDRYANIEINYLLQRMEAYRGLAILATNMKSALDQAFMRRLRFVVNFPYPVAEDRKRIWQRVFPKKTPTVGLDFDRLKNFDLTGGNIHNIALNAAFLGARRNEPVTMDMVFEAVRTELRKIGRPIKEADFRPKRAERAAR